MKFKVSLLMILLIGLVSFATATPIKIADLRIYPNKTLRLVFDMSGPTSYKWFTLKNPNRIVIDFSNTKKTFRFSRDKFKNTIIKDMRFAKKSNNRLRIVFDLATTCKKHIFQLKPSGKRGYRIVLDLTPISNNKKLLSIKNTISTPNPKIKALRDTIIVLDPGHGGRDPGATGQMGTHEKNITLAIGLDLRRDLRKLPGIKVYMTRSRDIYPTLSQRLSLARRVKADLFMSIHADAYKNRSTQGATVFALSQGRATSAAAKWIAERENKSELLGGIDLADKSHMLRSVLVDLSQTATIDASLKLGKDIVSYLRKITKMHSKRVEQASLYVLTSPDIPAVLVETGFISNLREERLLRTKKHQQAIALALERGIKRYLIDNPIQGTIFTAKMFSGKYIVKRGNTLSGIAAKFKISERQLKQFNHLKNSTLFPGQVLHIPVGKN